MTIALQKRNSISRPWNPLRLAQWLGGNIHRRQGVPKVNRIDDSISNQEVIADCPEVKTE